MDAYEISEDAGAYRLALSGRLTYNDHKEMMLIIQHLKNSSSKAVVVNLEKLVFIDSSAVGMILILAQEVKNIGGTTSLENPTGQVDRVLRTAKIYDLLLTPHYTEGVL